jgi:phage baseplate assembly protein V
MSAFKSMLKPLRERVMLMIAKAVVTMTDDGGGVQRVQMRLLSGETRSAASRFQNYGLSSRPAGQALAVALFVGGGRDHPLVVALEDTAARPRGLRPGEVIVYDDQGQSVHLTRDGIVIDGGGRAVTIRNAPKLRADVPLFECTGEIKDRCDAGGVTMAGMRSVYDGHTHPGDSGGQTGGVNQKMNP